MKKIDRQNHRIKIEVCILGISTLLLVCNLIMPNIIEKNKEPTQEEIEAFYNTLLPCGNHTNAYKDPELYNGKYYSTEYDMYFSVAGNTIRLFGNNEDITILTEKQLRILYPDETDFKSINESSKDVRFVFNSWENEVNINMVATMHYSPDNLDVAPIFDKTIITLSKDGIQYRPMLFYEANENETPKIIFGEVEFRLLS